MNSHYLISDKKMSQNNKEKKIRNKIVHIAFTQHEKEEIKDFASDSNMTASEFIRDAIREKIKRIKNPEIMNQGSIQFNPELLLKISKDTQKLVELNEEKEKRENAIKNILETSEAIQEEYKRLKEKGLMADLEKETIKIRKLLEGHKSLSRQQISDMTKIESNKVAIIITNKKFFKLNVVSGRYSKR